MDEIWAELSAAMHSLRRKAGVSLRTVEALSGIRRGTLSQAENAKARPSRRAVEYYDTAFGGDGLLVSMWAEARVAGGPSRRSERGVATEGDAMSVVGSVLPQGHLARPGERITAGWSLRNVGVVPWRDRMLWRVGPTAVPTLVESDPNVPVPDCDPGTTVDVRAEIRTPEHAGTFAAYWHLADGAGRTTLVDNRIVGCVVAVRE